MRLSKQVSKHTNACAQCSDASVGLTGLRQTSEQPEILFKSLDPTYGKFMQTNHVIETEVDSVK